MSIESGNTAGAGDAANAERPPVYARIWNEKRTGFTLPPVPTGKAALCGWLTMALGANHDRPISNGTWLGARGADGHIMLDRAGAPAIHLEPARIVNQPLKLVEVLAWQLTPDDAAVHKLDGGHCRDIAYALRCLCDMTGAVTVEEETERFITAYLLSAELVTDQATHGGPTERYKAADALRGPEEPGRYRYLIDRDTGEYVIPTEGLAYTARRQKGTLPRGWLDARMQLLGWHRVQLQGWAAPGRAGRLDPHSHRRVHAYRGFLPTDESDESVNT